MGATPAKYMMPSSPIGASSGINTLNPVQPNAVNPQQPLLPSNFSDPGTMAKGGAQSPLTQGAGNWRGQIPSLPNFGGGFF